MRSFTIPVPLVLLAASQISTFLYYQSVKRAAESQTGLTPPKSPSSPMRCESRDVERGEGGSGDTGGLYPALPSAPDPPYNPHSQPVVGNRRCDSGQCVTCTRMVEG